MIRIIGKALVFSVAAFAACSSQPSDGTEPRPDTRLESPSNGITLTINTPEVVTGADVAFTFANGSDDTVTTGALDCVNHYERLDGETWIKVESLRACIMLAQIHEPGSSSNHVTPAPDSPGRYRLVVEGGLGTDGGTVTAKSAEFEVQR